MNNFEEDKIIKFARIFIGIVSLILTIFEDLKHSADYALLMNLPIEKEKLDDQNCIKIILILGLGNVFQKKVNSNIFGHKFFRQKCH